MLRSLVVGTLIAVAAAPPVALAERCTPMVEEHSTWGSATLRAHSTDLEDCTLDEAGYRRVVAAWLQQRASDAPELTSLSLRRAVNLPWIAAYLVDTALQRPEQLALLRASTSGEHNRLVAQWLSEPAMLQRFAQPFADSGYTVLGVTVEKVLVGRAAEHAANHPGVQTVVPFDAQVWLRLQHRTNEQSAQVESAQ